MAAQATGPLPIRMLKNTFASWNALPVPDTIPHHWVGMAGLGYKYIL